MYNVYKCPCVVICTNVLFLGFMSDFYISKGKHIKALATRVLTFD